VGTYKLDEASGKRHGALHMLRLQTDGSVGARLAPLPTAGLQLPGVFDLRWRPSSAMPQLAAALADGSLRLLGWESTALLQGGGMDIGRPPTMLARLPPPPADDAAAAEPDLGASGHREVQGSETEGQQLSGAPLATSLGFSCSPGSAGERLAASYSSGQLQVFQVGSSASCNAPEQRPDCS
jgi:hypothetical protein